MCLHTYLGVRIYSTQKLSSRTAMCEPFINQLAPYIRTYVLVCYLCTREIGCKRHLAGLARPYRQVRQLPRAQEF